MTPEEAKTVSKINAVVDEAIELHRKGTEEQSSYLAVTKQACDAAIAHRNEAFSMFKDNNDA